MYSEIMQMLSSISSVLLLFFFKVVPETWAFNLQERCLKLLFKMAFSSTQMNSFVDLNLKAFAECQV